MSDRTHEYSDNDENLLKTLDSKIQSAIQSKSIKIIEVSKLSWRQRYIFAIGEESVSIDFIYTKKGKITVQSKHPGAKTLLAEIFSLNDITILQDITTKIIIDEEFPETYLIDIYNEIKVHANNHGIGIVDIKHFQYKERYFFYRNIERATIDLTYNSKGAITGLVSFPRSGDSLQLQKDVESLIKNL